MPEAQDENNITIMRKRLIFRSGHRGTKEMDELLGRFAEATVPGMSAGQLALYDAFLNNSDPDIFNWVSGAEPVPPNKDNEVVRMLLGFFK